MRRTDHQYALISALVLCFLSATVCAATNTSGDLFDAYYTVTFRRAMFADMERRYPDMQREIVVTKRKFERAYGPSCQQLVKYLMNLDGILDIQRGSVAKLLGQIRNESQQRWARLSYSEVTARAYLKEVDGEVGGKLPLKVRRVFANFNPKYMEAPVLELRDGKAVTYSFGAYDVGANFGIALDIPISWTPERVVKRKKLEKSGHVFGRFSKQFGFVLGHLDLRLMPAFSPNASREAMFRFLLQHPDLAGGSGEVLGAGYITGAHSGGVWVMTKDRRKVAGSASDLMALNYWHYVHGQFVVLGCYGAADLHLTDHGVNSRLEGAIHKLCDAIDARFRVVHTDG